MKIIRIRRDVSWRWGVSAALLYAAAVLDLAWRAVPWPLPACLTLSGAACFCWEVLHDRGKSRRGREVRSMAKSTMVFRPNRGRDGQGDGEAEFGGGPEGPQENPDVREAYDRHMKEGGR